jgi:2-(1,2-epoxy-1,2-dihydrophenyl)acetyl-CoA isomerase
MSLRTGNYCGFTIVGHEHGIVTITFNRPESLNASTAPMKRDLVEALTQIQMDDLVRVVILTGEGDAFWAGDNLKGPAGEKSAEVPPIHGGHHREIGTYNGLRTISQSVNTALRNLDKLTIAAINGFAIQTGFSAALCCDFRIAARSAKLGSATLRFGLLPDEGGQWLLVRLLGAARAMDFMMRRRIVSAANALDLGLVTEVVDDDALMGAAMNLATELATGPQIAMRMLKRSIYLATELTWEQALDEIASKTAITDHHPDAQEGGRAFLEKRSPVFNQWLDELEKNTEKH